MIARQSLVDGEAGDQLVTLFRSKREDRRSRRSLVAGRIAPARLPNPLHIPTDHPPHVFRHGHPVGTGCANLMRRIIVHAANAARYHILVHLGSFTGVRFFSGLRAVGVAAVCTR